MAMHILYLLTTALILLSVPVGTLEVSSRLFVFVGLLGLWRYSWAIINFGRALWYRLVDYPRLKRRADKAFSARGAIARAYFLVTTFKIETEVSIRVYNSLFSAAAAAPHGATVVAAIVDMSDRRLIQSIYAQARCDHVELQFVHIPGTGKRDALACGLAAIAAHAPTPEDIVVLVDGDTCVPVDVVERTAPFFSLDGNVGALTTDELCQPRGSARFRDWYALRFAQRHLMMCSMGLARRVLTLTGRMSVFRGDLATNPEFISVVQHDEIEHWRLGEVKFLTGDDKSTWFWLLQAGYQMLYLPDLQSVAMESQPRPGFVDSARVLMTRWFGNMLRTNGRAVSLSPRNIGFFTWWSILDQRISMWSTLTGPLTAVFGAIFVDPGILVFYVGWVMASRYAYCLALMLFRPRFPASFPFLVYFNQVYGAALKSYILFRIDRQRWTRQSLSYSTTGGRLSGVLKGASSFYLHVLSLASLATLVCMLGGLL